MPSKKKKKSPGRPRKTTAKQLKEMKALIPIVEQKIDDDDVIEGEVVENVEYDGFGRPTVVTEAVKKKLHEAFAWGCSNKEAALHAGIAETTLDNYNKKNPDFKARSEELKENPILLARACIVKAIETSPYYALKFLERKKSDEFSLRIKQTFDEPEPLTPEEQQILDDVLDDNL